MRSNPSAPIVAIGEVLWDMIPSGARLGGTITNFAVVTARLGDYSAVISCLGNDTLGHDAAQRLTALATTPDADTHIDLSCIQISHTLPTGTVSVTLDSIGHPEYEIHNPVAWDAILISDAMLDLAARASVICFGTLAQRHEISRDSIRALVAHANPGCVRMCDLNLRAPFANAEVIRWCLAHVDVLKVSDEELPEVARLLGDPSMAAGFPASSASEALTAAATNAANALLWHAPQCRLVAITLGPHGSLLVDRTGTYRHSGFEVKVADTVGAGDAFTAGLVHAYIRGASLAQISEVSNRCGSYVASQIGATPELPPSLLEAIESALRA
jgi:fructokinase